MVKARQSTPEAPCVAVAGVTSRAFGAGAWPRQKSDGYKSSHPISHASETCRHGFDKLRNRPSRNLAIQSSQRQDFPRYEFPKLTIWSPAILSLRNFLSYGISKLTIWSLKKMAGWNLSRWGIFGLTIWSLTIWSLWNFSKWGISRLTIFVTRGPDGGIFPTYRKVWIRAACGLTGQPDGQSPPHHSPRGGLAVGAIQVIDTRGRGWGAKPGALSVQARQNEKSKIGGGRV